MKNWYLLIQNKNTITTLKAVIKAFIKIKYATHTNWYPCRRHKQNNSYLQKPTIARLLSVFICLKVVKSVNVNTQQTHGKIQKNKKISEGITNVDTAGLVPLFLCVWMCLKSIKRANRIFRQYFLVSRFWQYFFGQANN